MGIKELWTVLKPFCERKPLYELQGKVVAIDLAGWICESLCVVDYEVQARFYLRNLFFRTSYLLLSGVTPVFVLEGTAPVLKHGMIAKRNENQFRGAAPKRNPVQTNDTSNAKKAPSKGRTRFNYILKQCEELIRSMGLQCVQGPGEAEAFCAHLNAAKLVDGVISQDSDCFAYGARRVYRNFSMSMQGTASSIGGSVEIYDLDVVNESMDLGRNKIVVMALLCGCDYCPEGVGGVGRDAVQKLFTMYSDREILERIRSWRANDNKYTAVELKVDDKMICVNCGHSGRVQKHAKSGCGQCKMSSGCDASLWKEQRLSIKSELQIRKKALTDDNFPFQEIIDEFFQTPIEMKHLELDWSQPNVIKFLRMMSSLLQWEEIYCFQKFLPLLTRWQLFHCANGKSSSPPHGIVCPVFIKKKRAPKGVASYEIVWKDNQKCFDGLIPASQLDAYLSTKDCGSDEDALQSLWSTIEPIDVVVQAYPDLVDTFLQSKIKPKKAPKRTKKIANNSLQDMNSLHEALNGIDVAPAKTKGTKKRKSPKTKKAKVTLQTLAKFLRPIAKASDEPVNSNVADPKPVSSSTAAKMIDLSTISIDLNDSENGECDLSDIINEMVSRPPMATEIGGRKLRFDAFNVPRVPSSPIDTEDEDDTVSSKENDIVNEKDCDESFDEFDLIVMGKGPTKSINEHKSSTPVLVNRFLKKHSLQRQVISPPASKSSKSSTSDAITTPFYSVSSADNDIDLFEQSIDFKNMPDEGDSDSDE